MSKPDASATKSLEEILASIRKSLAGAGEGSDAARGPRGAAPMPPAPEPEPLADAAGDGDGLSARLAGALNGPTNGAALDDDFMELLAPDDTRPVPPEADATAKPADARSEGRDPLWFLRQPVRCGPERRRASTGGPHAARRGGTAPARPRPRLRPRKKRSSSRGPRSCARRCRRCSAPRQSIPRSPGRRRMRPSPRTSPRRHPRGPHLQRRSGLHGCAGQHLHGEDAALDAAAPAGRRDGQGCSRARGPAGPRGSWSRRCFARPPLISVADAAPGPQPPAEAKPANGLLGEPHADAAAKPPPTPVQEPSAAKPAPAAEAPPARSLEQVIGEMLEPFIRQWLDANLPRMVEQVVREEVARAIAAGPRVPKV